MTWGEFQVERDLYKRAWEEMKNSFSGPIRAFLEKSRIVVSCGREFEIDADFKMAREACPAFFETELAPEHLKVNADRLQITPRWAIRVRFPYVDIDFIQAVKVSHYCDKRRTLIKPAFTRVFLLPER